MNKRKRHRIGLKLPTGEFIELLYMRRTRDGIVVWVPKSGKHFTILDEGVSISSHATDEVRDEIDHILMG